MRRLEDELVELLEAGVVFDRSEKPYSPVVTIVATQRPTESQLRKVEDFLEQLIRVYPKARLVVGDTSGAEKEAVRAAEMLGIPYRVIEKGEKGAWDEGSLIRDERVVAASSHVVLMDDSARCKSYEALAKRGHRHVSKI